jgi:5-methylcytosine-specific restriction endonuclease McrA
LREKIIEPSVRYADDMVIILGLKMLNDEKVHLHHVDENHQNWKTKNLLAIHESCHDYIHMSKSAS